MKPVFCHELKSINLIPVFEPMKEEAAKKRMESLARQIDKHNYAYYVDSSPGISDYDFDMLMEELMQLEKEFPRLASPESPTQRVGGQVTKQFRAVRHKYPM